jgi:thiosulfate/3-mercaptopyruvate sulfurtransferase
MLIDSAQLNENLQRSDWIVFDCRHDLADIERGARVYRESHIPGAHFAPVDTALSGAKTGRNGRHPLPAADDFAAFLTRHGVTPQSLIVAYDDVGGLYAARLWWMARWIGHCRVALLDGGWMKWTAEGRVVDADLPVPVPQKPLPVRENGSLVLSADDVLRQLGEPSFALVDARAAERYRGEVEPMDPVAGHIPGALNRFYKANLNPDLTFRPAAELKCEFNALIGTRAPEQVGHQCGSGITACANIFAMEYAGLGGSKLYAGSWSEWVADPSRPVAKAPC